MSDIQTLSNTQSRVTYAGNNVTTAFPTTFAFLDNSHLVVELSTDAGVSWTAQVEGDHYDADGAGDEEPGGTVTMLTAPAAGETLRITRDTPITQETELQTSGPLPAKTIITALVKLTMVAQERDRRITDLEAGAVTTTLASSVVTTTFVATEPVENGFPLNVPCVGTPAHVLLTRLENLTDGTSLPAEGLRWSLPIVGQFTMDFVEGLEPGKQYRLSFLVLT